MTKNVCVTCGAELPLERSELICEKCKRECCCEMPTVKQPMSRRVCDNTLRKAAAIALGEFVFAALILMCALSMRGCDTSTMAATQGCSASAQAQQSPPCAAITEPTQPRENSICDITFADVKTVAEKNAVKTVQAASREFKVTAYCPCEMCCDGTADGITATGTTATAGRTIAVDPDVIPLGSKILVGGTEYIAEDIGGAIKGDRVEIYFDTHEAALGWGVQYMEVSVK